MELSQIGNALADLRNQLGMIALSKMSWSEMPWSWGYDPTFDMNYGTCYYLVFIESIIEEIPWQIWSVFMRSRVRGRTPLVDL